MVERHIHHAWAGGTDSRGMAVFYLLTGYLARFVLFQLFRCSVISDHWSSCLCCVIVSLSLGAAVFCLVVGSYLQISLDGFLNILKRGILLEPSRKVFHVIQQGIKRLTKLQRYHKK